MKFLRLDSMIGAHHRAENFKAKIIEWRRNTAGFEFFQHDVAQRYVQSAPVEPQMETADWVASSRVPSWSDSAQEPKVQTRERMTGQTR